MTQISQHFIEISENSFEHFSKSGQINSYVEAALQLAAQRAAQRAAAAQPRPARDVSPRTLALAESMRRTLTLRRARQ